MSKGKPRHIKTFPEKYGLDSVEKEAKEFLDKLKWSDRDEEAFEYIPYLGFLYIPLDINNWWYDCEYVDIIRAKVLAVDDTHVLFTHYDCHHRDIVILKREYKNFKIKGNVLLKNE